MLRQWLTWPGKALRTPALDAQLNVYNVAAMRARPAAVYDYLRFDPNNTCNVHCVYCHNHRSSETVPTEDFLDFLERGVADLQNFQMGCVMEPTLDSRLGDLLLAVRQSRNAPRRELVLQTNGILLHRHDAGQLRDARVTRLSVSIDSADPAVHRALRGGTSLSKVAGNVRAFRGTCQSAEVHFITTVTRINLPALEHLVTFGLDLGVSRFVLREVFYYPDSTVVDHSRMADLTLRPGEYAEMAARLTDRFSGLASFEFADHDRLQHAEEKMVSDSLRTQPPD